MKIKFGLDKCVKAKVKSQNIQLNHNQVTQNLEQSEMYKYLGMEEGEGPQHH